MTEMRDIIQHMNEAKSKLFPGADDAELSKRKEVEKARRAEKYGSRTADICPHCHADLREVGVEQHETTYSSVDMVYIDNGWDYGRSRDYDSDVGDSFCGECERDLVRGRDWDVWWLGS